MLELPKAAEMREADRLTIARGTPGIVLMQRAGAAAARAAVAMLVAPARVLVLCGPGNNGGDGFVAAIRLAEIGHAVTVELLGARDALTGDAALAAQGWSGPVDALGRNDAGRFDLVVDALFGTGLRRDLEGDVAAAIAAINGSGTPVLAIDVPSGIDADSGAVRGAAIAAARTVTFARRKPGHLFQPGRRHCGAVAVVEIGISQETIAATGCNTFLNAPDLWMDALPRPAADGHKFDRGHVLVVSGEASRTGAARLSARGALRAGAGLVTLATTREAMPINAAQLTAVMLAIADTPDDLAELLADKRTNALVLGPGLGIGAATRRRVEVALAADRATVLDADALTSFAGDLPGLAACIARERTMPVVLTPHAGEFRRLFGDAAAAVPSKLERAREAARVSGAIIVMKGSDTVIAAPDGRAAVTANGGPYLATAGAGDVLCGFIAALLAQGMPGFEATAAAVWMHAELGRRLGPGLIAEDLPESLPGLLRDLVAYDAAAC